MKLKLLFLLIFGIFIIPVFANAVIFTTTSDVFVPDEFQIFTDQAVNFSWRFTGNASAAECAVFNSSTLSGNFTELFSPITVENNTFINRTITMNDNSRNWWYVSCSNSTAIPANFTNTSTRGFDVDVNYNLVSFGIEKLINMTFDTGMITIGGASTSVPANITFYNATGFPFSCGVVGTGTFTCSAR